jgi:hypothetical protein
MVLNQIAFHDSFPQRGYRSQPRVGPPGPTLGHSNKKNLALIAHVAPANIKIVRTLHNPSGWGSPSTRVPKCPAARPRRRSAYRLLAIGYWLLTR